MSRVSCKANIPPETAFALATQRQWKLDKQHEIYMASGTQCKCAEANRLNMVCVGVCVGHNVGKEMVGVPVRSVQLFRYQHVGIPYAKVWHWLQCLSKSPEANSDEQILNIMQ